MTRIMEPVCLSVMVARFALSWTRPATRRRVELWMHERQNVAERNQALVER